MQVRILSFRPLTKNIREKNAPSKHSTSDWTTVFFLQICEDLGVREGRRWVKVLCACGRNKEIRLQALTSPRSSQRSCGCRLEYKSHNKLDYGIAAFNHIVDAYKRQAKDRNLTFSLSDEQILYLVTSDCAYCGAHPRNIMWPKGGNGYFIYNGIDRFNNNIGYEPFNCKPCCRLCNLIKLDHDPADLASHLTRMKICDEHSYFL